MSGRACKAIICSSQLAAASEETRDFVTRELTTREQEKEIIEVTETAIKALNKIAGDIDNGRSLR